MEIQPVFNRDVLSTLVDTATSVLLELEAFASGDDLGSMTNNKRSPDLRALAVRAEDDLDTDILRAVVSESLEPLKEIMTRLTQKPNKDAAARLTRVFMQAMSDAGDCSLQAVVDTGLIDFAYEDEISGRVCIHEAVLSGRLFPVRLCLSTASNLSKIDVYGRTALHYACMQSTSSDRLSALLLENNAPVNVLDHNISSPLHYAIINGNLESVQLLLQYGAEINPKTDADYIPLSMACARGHFEIAKLLLENGAKIIHNAEGLLPIHLVARAGHRGLCKLLFEHKIDIEARDKFSGWTPMFFAASEGHVTILQELIDCGGLIDVRDEEHHSPTYYAAWEGHKAALQVLLDAGGAFGNTESHLRRPAQATTISEESVYAEELDDGIPSLLLPPP